LESSHRSPDLPAGCEGPFHGEIKGNGKKKKKKKKINEGRENTPKFLATAVTYCLYKQNGLKWQCIANSHLF